MWQSQGWLWKPSPSRLRSELSVSTDLQQALIFTGVLNLVSHFIKLKIQRKQAANSLGQIFLLALPLEVYPVANDKSWAISVLSYKVDRLTGWEGRRMSVNISSLWTLPKVCFGCSLIWSCSFKENCSTWRGKGKRKHNAMFFESLFSPDFPFDANLVEIVANCRGSCAFISIWPGKTWQMWRCQQTYHMSPSCRHRSTLRQDLTICSL